MYCSKGQRGFKNGNMIQHGVYHKNTRIFYRGKIVSSSYVQDCRSLNIFKKERHSFEKTPKELIDNLQILQS